MGLDYYWTINNKHPFYFSPFDKGGQGDFSIDPLPIDLTSIRQQTNRSDAWRY